MRNTRLSVIVWNEHIQEHDNPAIRANYPEGLHAVIAQALRRTPGIVRWLEGEEVTEMEPELFSEKAFYSPDSGIVDTGSYMLSLEGDILNGVDDLADLGGKYRPLRDPDARDDD